MKNTRKIKQQQYTSLVLNYIMLENIIWKKVVYTITFYVQFSCVAEYLKHSNNNIHNNNDKYANYNITEIYINKLSTRKQIFIAMDCLIMMSEKYIYFRKRKKTFGKDISYPLHRSNWIHVLWKYFSNYVFSKDIYKNLKEIGIIQDLLKLIIFGNLWVSKLHSSLKLIHKLKQWNLEYIEYSFLCEKPTFSAKHILIHFVFVEERW